MPSSRADVVGFLLDEARLTQAFWVGRIPYVWPIRKVNAPQQRSPSNEVQRKCTQAGEDFMERCSRMAIQRKLPFPSADDKE